MIFEWNCTMYRLQNMEIVNIIIYRVCPSTKIDFKLSKQYSNAEIFSIDDGSVTIDLTSQGNSTSYKREFYVLDSDICS